MTPIIIVAVLLAILTTSVVVGYHVYKPNKLESPKKKQAIESAPEPILDMERTERKRAEREKEQIDWNKEYTSLLPDHERPDYILPGPDDLLDDEESIFALGGPAVTYRRYKKIDGRKYFITIVFDTKVGHEVITLSHGDYRKDVTDTFENMIHPDTHKRGGNCITCGKFKAYNKDGNYYCRDEYKQNEIWRHK